MNKQKIAVVVPTIRDIEPFLNEWGILFARHKVTLYIVHDGVSPTVEVNKYVLPTVPTEFLYVSDVMGEYADLIYNYNDGVRNLGFAQAYKDGADVIISLDDDVTPEGDTITEHLIQLEREVPISWMNTTEENFMRGFPYNVRKEANVVLSHGVWKGVADFDASTQLVIGTPEQTPIKTVVPRGVLFPMCIMNVAFKRFVMPFMYQAPMGKQLDIDYNVSNLNRFADIWGGIEAKGDIDNKGWAVVTGYAVVNHQRASDPLVNLQKEARGVGMNEEYGEHAYFSFFKKKRERWQEFLKQFEQ